jgi:uncharacterized phage protein (TIGR01671 family)
MKREILFRGLRTDGKGWVYGCLVISPDSNRVMVFNDREQFVSVKSETVGQFTGLHDKDGVKIWEGSRMKISLPMGGFWGNVKEDKEGVVVYEPEKSGFLVEWDGISPRQNYERLDCDLAFTGEVVGNIHEQ